MQRFGAYLDQHALLGVHLCRGRRVDAEESRVEQVNALNKGTVPAVALRPRVAPPWHQPSGRVQVCVPALGRHARDRIATWK